MRSLQFTTPKARFCRSAGRVLPALLLLIWQSPFSQSLSPVAISSFAGSGTVDNLQLDWTMGEIAASTGVTSSRIYTEGFHQPLLTVSPRPQTRIQSDQPDALSFRVFPNPASTSVSIRFDEPLPSSGDIELMTIQGQALDVLRLKSGDLNAEFPLLDYPAGIYLLRIRVDEERPPVIYKISKI